MKNSLKYYVAWTNSPPGMPLEYAFYWSAHRAGSKENLADATEAYRKERGIILRFEHSRLMKNVKC